MNGNLDREFLEYHIKAQRVFIRTHVEDARIAAPGSPLRESINQSIRRRLQSRRKAQEQLRKIQ